MKDYELIYDSFKRGKLHPLYNLMFPTLLRYATRLAGEQFAYLAKDCVQDAIFQSYLRRNTFNTANHWRNYLFISIRNNVIDLIRKADYDQAYMDNVLLSDNEEEDISLAIIYNDALDVIYEAVESLPEKYRILFKLSFVEGMKIADIADKLCVSEITVKKRKAKLIEKIKIILGKDLDNYIMFILLAA